MMMNDKDSHNPRSTFSARWATILSGFVVALAVVATPLVGIARAEDDARTDDQPVVKTDDRREPERERERRTEEHRGREREGERRDGERRRDNDERPKRIVCTAGVEDGWVVAEGRTRDRRRKLIWRLRLGRTPKGKDPELGIRYDSPFVVITSGKQRFVINVETGQLRRSGRPEARPGREDHAIRERLEQAEKKVVELEKNLEKAEGNLKRLIRLHKEGRADEGAVEKAEIRFKEARGKLRTAQDKLKKLRAAARSRRGRRSSEGGERVERREGGERRERTERRREDRERRVERAGGERERRGERERSDRKGDVEELREQIRHLQRQLEQAKQKLKRIEREPHEDKKRERHEDEKREREGDREREKD